VAVGSSAKDPRKGYHLERFNKNYSHKKQTNPARLER
jgi:hypothetical protein